jgi:hypothetical protein
MSVNAGHRHFKSMSGANLEAACESSSQGRLQAEVRLEHRSFGPLWILPKITKDRVRFVDSGRVFHDIEQEISST